MKADYKMIVLYGILLLFGSVFSQCTKDNELGPQLKTSENYYIDSLNGNDSNDGSSPEKAWKSFRNLKQIILEPGNSVNLRKGSVWNEVFEFRGSGEEDKPIIIKSYGEGKKPKIDAQGKTYAFIIKNQEYIEVTDLEITNTGDTYAEDRKGIYIEFKDFGVVHHIHLKNLEIHDVNGVHGNLSDGDFQKNKKSGGIISFIMGDQVETYFDDFLIESCHIHHVSQTGIGNFSSWEDREWPRSGGVYTNYSWVPSLNMVIRNNTIEHVAGNGIIIREAHAPLVEYNRLDYCGEFTTGNAAFCFNTDYALFQYNVVSNTIYNQGDVDSGGLDSDFKTRWTTFQYNYCYNNGRGGLLATGGPQIWKSAFNYETIFRYNLLVNNRDHGIKTSGNVMNMKVYNNHIYSDLDESIEVIQHSDWSGSSRSVEYFNNIFYCNASSRGSINLGSSTGNIIHDNLFKGVSEHSAVKKEDNLWDKTPVYQVGSNPQVGNVESFRLASTSPGVDAGNNNQYGAKDGNGGVIEIMDFFGGHVPRGKGIDIGMEEFK